MMLLGIWAVTLVFIGGSELWRWRVICRAQQELVELLTAYRLAFPDACFVCAHDRWCTERGIGNDLGMFPHRCVEKLAVLRGDR